MAKTWKEWEKPLIELDEAIAKIEALIESSQDDKQEELSHRLAEVKARRDRYIDVRYSRLGPWENTLVARADRRPYTLDYVTALISEFTELDGDRRFGADQAIVGGPGFFNGRAVMVVGHQKGRNIQERQHRNFGMAKPEGYRKAMRLFDMACRFNMPVITFVDTPAADPGVESESRGISEAIAASTMKMFELEVPVVSVIIGEGGSGGAIGIAVGNRVLMQEHAIYSVIPPEGCAAILWRDPDKGPQAAAALRLTSDSALELGLIDAIIQEPKGGAHRDPIQAIHAVRDALTDNLAALSGLEGRALREQRYAKFRAMGHFNG